MTVVHLRYGHDNVPWKGVDLHAASRPRCSPETILLADELTAVLEDATCENCRDAGFGDVADGLRFGGFRW